MADKFPFSGKIYKTNSPINYVLQKGVTNTHLLVIIFSGFNSPEDKIQHSYNYMRVLSPIDCHKLFILDSYGPRGCYYLGQNMSFEVETSVLSLITSIVRRLNVDWQNIVAVGSSKGGSAALYFGLKYNFGYIIAGAPQVLLADYINKTTVETARFILGEDNPKENSIHLNEIIFKQLDKIVDTEIYLLSSENDWQYQIHVKPLLDEMDKHNVKYHIKIDNAMKSHGDIATYFPNFLLNLLSDFTSSFN
ncbi:hypothetical protein DESME_04470 [Desulfitobacterium metallireducens DSM 15288]|uniref:Two component regulator three Y domain-containing protein n=2 Tax=Desulfitobacterium TaxID=36853 RepID=W0EGZ3_9FIRM|nr:hypothetical protein DESME_04470 [Desulfitobacterium metallireducens DSM 15288]